MEASLRTRKRKKSRKPRPWGLFFLLILNLIIIIAMAVFFVKFSDYSKKQDELLSDLSKQLKTYQVASVGETAAPQEDLTTSSEASTATETTLSSELPVTNTTQNSAQQTAAAETATDDEITPSSSTYTVKLGDSLSTIAEQHGLTLSQLMTMNNLTDPTILIGTVLTVK